MREMVVRRNYFQLKINIHAANVLCLQVNVVVSNISEQNFHIACSYNITVMLVRQFRLTN
jgi:hypothetical protein